MKSMSQADSAACVRAQKRETQNSARQWEFRIKGKDPERRVEEAEATEEKKWPDNECWKSSASQCGQQEDRRVLSRGFHNGL